MKDDIGAEEALRLEALRIYGETTAALLCLGCLFSSRARRCRLPLAVPWKDGGLSPATPEHEAYRECIASTFATVHISVEASSDKMLNELKRHNYITPTHFLELVKGYKQRLAEKRSAAPMLSSRSGKAP